MNTEVNAVSDMYVIVILGLTCNICLTHFLYGRYHGYVKVIFHQDILYNVLVNVPGFQFQHFNFIISKIHMFTNL